jgi:hypothetical protein
MFKPEGDTWNMTQGDVHLTAHVRMKPFNHPQQLFEEQLHIEVQEGEARFSLASHSLKRAVYPQEFLGIVRNMGQFEFVGWWNNWNLDDPLTSDSENIFRPIALLRKQ